MDREAWWATVHGAAESQSHDWATKHKRDTVAKKTVCLVDNMVTVEGVCGFLAGPRLSFLLCSLLSFQWAPPIAVITIRNSAVKQTTAASRSGPCAMALTTAGTTLTSRTVVGGAAWGEGRELTSSGSGLPTSSFLRLPLITCCILQRFYKDPGILQGYWEVHLYHLKWNLSPNVKILGICVISHKWESLIYIWQVCLVLQTDWNGWEGGGREKIWYVSLKRIFQNQNISYLEVLVFRMSLWPSTSFVFGNIERFYGLKAKWINGIFQD